MRRLSRSVIMSKKTYAIAEVGWVHTISPSGAREFSDAHELQQRRGESEIQYERLQE